jgi:hypothetical protein
VVGPRVGDECGQAVDLVVAACVGPVGDDLELVAVELEERAPRADVLEGALLAPRRPDAAAVDDPVEEELNGV